MPFASTGPLRHELDRALPSRPFGVRFWDGTVLPSTDGKGATFTVRSPAAVACALRAPGQLGLGRAYVAGLIEVDDLDATLICSPIGSLRRWTAPARPGSRSRRCGLRIDAAAAGPGTRAAPARPAPQPRP